MIEQAREVLVAVQGKNENYFVKTTKNEARYLARVNRKEMQFDFRWSADEDGVVLVERKVD